MLENAFDRINQFFFFPCVFTSGILEKLLSQENRVLEVWTGRKKRLDQCRCVFICGFLLWSNDQAFNLFSCIDDYTATLAHSFGPFAKC